MFEVRCPFGWSNPKQPDSNLRVPNRKSSRRFSRRSGRWPPTRQGQYSTASQVSQSQRTRETAGTKTHSNRCLKAAACQFLLVESKMG